MTTYLDLAAEIARQTEVIRRVNARCDHLGIRLGEVIKERDDMRALHEHALSELRLLGYTIRDGMIWPPNDRAERQPST